MLMLPSFVSLKNVHYTTGALLNMHKFSLRFLIQQLYCSLNTSISVMKGGPNFYGKRHRQE